MANMFICACVDGDVNIDDRFRARSEFITFQSQMVIIINYYYYLLLYKMLNVCYRYSSFKNRYFICIE